MRKKNMVLCAGLMAAFCVGWGGHGESAWSQWGQSAAHDGSIDAVGQDADRVVGSAVIDPFVDQEQAETGGALLVHYGVPLSSGKDVFLMTKRGSYTPCDPPGSGQPAGCGIDGWNSQIWTERSLRWEHGALVEKWAFESDWKPEPVPQWEPTFQAALTDDFVYVPGAGGTVFELWREGGQVHRRINPFGETVDPSRYVSGPISIDAHGNVLYNVLQLDPVAPWSTDAAGWLVKVSYTGAVQRVSYADLTPGAPAPTDLCSGSFGFGEPRPPGAAPPSSPCLSQRPPVNVAPTVGPDGTIFTVSRAHGNPAYGYLLALRPDLSVRWARSLRGLLADGCGVLAPYGSGVFDCPAWMPAGADPFTGAPPAAVVDDRASSSPVALPDGGVIYGAMSYYNGFRGHLFKFGAAGAPLGSYDFGWDITPAVYRHGGTYSIVIKDNDYFNGGPFAITQLSKNLVPEWKFFNTSTQSCQRAPDGSITCQDDEEHPNGFEWCINAPAVDRDGTVYVTSEDGNFYAIGQGGVEKERAFLEIAEGAAYTPLSLDGKGRIYAMNDGRLTVLGQ